MTEAQIRAQLLKEEDDEERDEGTTGLHEVTASGMLSALLDFEDHQYVPLLKLTSTTLIIL